MLLCKLLTKCHSQGRSLSPLIIIIIIIIINKVLIKVTLNKVIAGTLHSYMWLKHCESTGLTVNSRMTIETEMDDGNTAVTACL